MGERFDLVFKVMRQRLIADSSEIRFLMVVDFRYQLFILILYFPDFSVHFFLLQCCSLHCSGGPDSQRQTLNKL